MIIRIKPTNLGRFGNLDVRPRELSVFPVGGYDRKPDVIQAMLPVKQSTEAEEWYRGFYPGRCSRYVHS